MFLVRLDELPPRESQRIFAAARIDVAGLVPVGVRDLQAEDVFSNKWKELSASVR